MQRYRFVYVDLKYQNRAIVSLTKIKADGSAEVIRATIENENYSRDPRNYLAFGVYQPGQHRGLEYVHQQSKYSEGIVLGRNSIWKEKYRDNPLPAEKFFSKINEDDPLTQIHKSMMDLKAVTFHPYPVIIKNFFLGAEITDKTGSNEMCDYIEITNPTEVQIQRVQALFYLCKDKKLFPAPASFATPNI